MATLATLQTWLSEAEIARHKLRTGSKAENVEKEGKRVTYTRAMADELDRYIVELQSQIRAAGGAVDGRLPRRAFVVEL